MAEEQEKERTWSVPLIIGYINDSSCWDNGFPWTSLGAMLEDIEWDEVASDLIEPKKVRNFAKKIVSEEVRLDVLKYLSHYSKQYFLEAAEDKEYNEKVNASIGIQIVMPNIKSATENLQIFQQELLFLIDQIEKKGEFSGNKFSKQQERIKQLEGEIKQLKSQNKELSAQLDKYKHPSAYGKHIPKELQREDFINIMNQLVKDGIVRRVIEPNAYGVQQLTCYYWDASKILFGYFIEKMNDVLGIRGGRIPLNWKLFEPVFFNYDELIGEARKALSTYNNGSSAQKNRMEDIEKVDNAIKNKDNTALL